MNHLSAACTSSHGAITIAAINLHIKCTGPCLVSGGWIVSISVLVLTLCVTGRFSHSCDVLNNRPPRSFHGLVISHHLPSFGPKVNVYMQYNWPPFYILHCIFVFIGMKKRQWWSEVMLRQVCIFLSQQRQPACDVFGINKDSNLAPWPIAA